MRMEVMGKDLQLGERSHSPASGEPVLADKSLAWSLRAWLQISALPTVMGHDLFHHLRKMSGTVSLEWAAGEMTTATQGKGHP